MTGHLFVIHGDMTKLACDGVLIPCDDNGNITRVWERFFALGRRQAGDRPSWFRSTE